MIELFSGNLSWEYPGFFLIAIIFGIAIIYWLMRSSSDYKKPQHWICRACGSEFKEESQQMYNFCPHCGTRKNARYRKESDDSFDDLSIEEAEEILKKADS